MDTRRSQSLFHRAQSLMPGGVNSPVRAFRAVGGTPRFVQRAQGAYFWDANGDRYIDYIGSWGPMILGHGHPAVLEAVQKAALEGFSYGAPTEREIDLAQEIIELVPSIEMVRLVSSGTEAAMSVLRVARAATGRDAVVKFAGCYHGHADGFLVEAGSGAVTLGVPTSPGIPGAAAALTLTARYNDLASVERAVDGSKGGVAAILVEPIAGNMGVVPPIPGFLEGLRAICDRTGALLVFDEVITGFRVSHGGAQELSGVLPDLTVMGKVIGGGLPAAAYGGSKELMELVAPAGSVYQAGTLSGNPLAVAAGRATLERLDEDAYVTLAATTEALAAGLREAAGSRPVQIAWAPGLLTVFFTRTPVRDYAGAVAADAGAYGAWCRALLARGVYPPPSQFEAWFLSGAHTPRDVETTLRAARQSFRELRD